MVSINHRWWCRLFESIQAKTEYSTLPPDNMTSKNLMEERYWKGRHWGLSDVQVMVDLTSYIPSSSCWGVAFISTTIMRGKMKVIVRICHSHGNKVKTFCLLFFKLSYSANADVLGKTCYREPVWGLILLYFCYHLLVITNFVFNQFIEYALPWLNKESHSDSVCVCV